MEHKHHEQHQQPAVQFSADQYTPIETHLLYHTSNDCMHDILLYPLKLINRTIYFEINNPNHYRQGKIIEYKQQTKQYKIHYGFDLGPNLYR
jgi:hypothetical protein